MTQTIFLENKKKKLNLPLRMLLCFAMFCFWQMGFIYFMGPSLTIDGRTPLPISMDNITILIALGYVLAIVFMMLFPHLVIWTGRITTAVALLTAIGLFLPFSSDILRLLIYTQAFCCCFMIGFETFIMINFLSEQNTIKHLTVAYSVALFMIAAVQNDLWPIAFPVFRIITVAALILLLLFYIGMPASKEACPHYVKKTDSLTRPKRLMAGTYLIIFVGSLMAVSGPSISGEVTHGVFITYFVDAVVSLLIYICYKKWDVHPFRSVSLCIGLGAIGFLLMFVSDYIPSFAYLSCVLIGIGMVPCQMLPLFGTVLMNVYPSRFYSSTIMGLALFAVLVQSSMVEIFRAMPTMLYLAYGVIMVVLSFIYMQFEPYFIYSLTEKTHLYKSSKQTKTKEDEESTKEIAVPAAGKTEEIPEESQKPDIDFNANESKEFLLLSSLTKREYEVLKLISYGYSNADIAKELVISGHTVNDYTKKIYRKLDVHSRHAAAHLLIKYHNISSKTNLN